MNQNFLTPEMLMLMLASAQQRPEQSMSDSEIAQLSGAGTIPARRDDIQHQLALAQALRQPGPQFSGIGGLCIVMRNILNQYSGGRMERRAQDDLSRLNQQQADTGMMYGRHVRDAQNPLQSLIQMLRGPSGQMQGLSPPWQPQGQNPYGMDNI